ncbi:MAG: ATP-binding protein [Mesorhizobium sp.]|uniref:ATP-dependent DNA helicase n=1 Tax=Mesorhizobium sp. TaxID=1871066 RepID=UPI000FE90C0E|nr:ATP-dependent RecD-like DNA helicase [Mesorhizobium sp.]RWC91697.1 MAG: ATP-binding protein [Mesorhizobium sp.]
MAEALNWSSGQQEAIATVAAWLRIRYAPYFYLAGYAGSGKTTLAKHVAALQKGKVRYAAFTGKAAKVMRMAGCEGAQTIHSMIYYIEFDAATGKVERRLRAPNAFEGTSLFIIDEVSMVNAELAMDLLSFGVPILVLGDPFQLPPVEGAGYFTAGKPTVMLTEVHRQAKDSPIVRLATDIREGVFRNSLRQGRLPGLTITRKADLDPTEVTEADAVIVGRNDTRFNFNRRLRELGGFTGDLPNVGETVICLRNDRDKAISNGELFRVHAVKKPVKGTFGRKARFAVIEPDVEGRQPIDVEVREQFFQGRAGELGWRQKKGTQEFDFGYALTCHKAQGSGWPRVCVFDESRVFREDADRWLYTAVTRASQHLTMVI